MSLFCKNYWKEKVTRKELSNSEKELREEIKFNQRVMFQIFEGIARELGLEITTPKYINDPDPVQVNKKTNKK